MYETKNPPEYPGEHNSSDFDLKDNPFDWRSLQSVCVGTAPWHPAYEMSFEEYAKNRKNVSDTEEHPPVQLGFRIPDSCATVLPVLARRRKAQTNGSMYKYLTLTIEKGLISLQHDYHDIYSEINHITDTILDYGSTEPDRFEWMCSSLNSQKINLGTSSRTHNLFSPSVAHWLSDAVRQVSGDLKMTISDLVVVAVSIGVIEECSTLPVPDNMLVPFVRYVRQFDFAIKSKSGITKQTISALKIDLDEQV